jgi:hypothetical protein
MTKSRLQRAVSRQTLSFALNRPIALGHNVNTIQSRHLLRALLRQSNYLPDAVARHYFYNYILGRYRKYHPRLPKPPNTPTLTPSRERSLLKEARKCLSFLTRANDGHPDRLLLVLMMAYGRTGKKRHELLKTVVSPLAFKSDSFPHVPADDQALAQLSASIMADYEKSATEERPVALSSSHRPNLFSELKKPRLGEGPELGPRLEALVNSQRQQKSTISQRPPVGTTQPSIPETNRWGRPMPPSRAANMKDKWYAMILDRVMPPLPESEWNRLRDLALGWAPWEGPMKRRTRLVQSEGHRSIENERGINSGITIPMGAGSVQENNDILKRESRKLLGTHPHTLTPRFMRHQWGKVFLQCPMMKWDTVRHRWEVKWGSTQRNKEVVLGHPSRINMDVFEGVDSDGNLVPTKSARM